MSDEQDAEQRQDENLRLRTAVEGALLFAEEVVAGAHERTEAEGIVAMLNEALEPADARAAEQALTTDEEYGHGRLD